MITPPNYQKDAIPTPQGWRHPRTNELLSARPIREEDINDYFEPKIQILKEAPTSFQEAKTELLTQSAEWDLKSMTKVELESLGRTHGIELDKRNSKSIMITELKEVL
jgi:hypothetical protein